MKKLARLLVAMMKQCAQFLSLNRDPASNSDDKGNYSVSVSLSSKSKHMFLKVVHRGGREELYFNEVKALQLMEKYPGTRVARPEFFKSPRESVLRPEENLLLGHKYLIIPSASVRKLQRKHIERPSESSEWDSVEMDLRETFEASVSSAKEFYVPPKGRSPKSLPARKGIGRKKPFVPPLPKTSPYRGLAWEPSLTSVQELSP